MTKLATSLTLAGFALGAGTLTASASSHREAPAIAEDQYVDNTDVLCHPTRSRALAAAVFPADQ